MASTKKFSIDWPTRYVPGIADQIIALKRASEAARAQIAAINRDRALARGDTGTIVGYMKNTPKHNAPGWMNGSRRAPYHRVRKG
jgi:hypothetical protein